MKLCKETMINSYNNISFSPERRGEQDFDYYTELLKSDLELLGENQGNYERKFIQKVMLIYYRQARCASVLITGAGNFPFRSNLKRVDSQRRAENDFSLWREKYFKAVNRERTLSPEEEIDKTLAEIDMMETKRELLKECNKLKTIEERVKFYQESGLSLDSRHYKTFCEGYKTCYKNLSIEIRERHKKLEIMKVRIKRKESFEPIKANGATITIEEDRVMIRHDVKPERSVLDTLKSRGFRWSPNFGAWVRKHTGNAVYDAKNLIGAN